jgi:2-polyprenyl-3-methyl-5-hydroxy-6-metoxy-1,4-benzoquinol methylase
MVKDRPVIEGDLLSSILRYRMMWPYVKGRTVVDHGCGEGHGSFMLSKHAERVYGVDIDDEAISKAKKLYTDGNLSFGQNWPSKLGPGKVCVDVVCALEFIEHVDEGCMKNLISNLWVQCSYSLIGTTPNGDKFPRPTEFHKLHYTYDHLYELLSHFYSSVNILGIDYDNGFNNYMFMARN